MNTPRDNVHDRRSGPIPFEARQHERDRDGRHGVRFNYGDPTHGHPYPNAHPSMSANPGWDHPSHGVPPMYNRSSGPRPSGGPDRQRNFRDDRFARNPALDRPFP